MFLQLLCYLLFSKPEHLKKKRLLFIAQNPLYAFLYILRGPALPIAGSHMLNNIEVVGF